MDKEMPLTDEMREESIKKSKGRKVKGKASDTIPDDF